MGVRDDGILLVDNGGGGGGGGDVTLVGSTITLPVSVASLPLPTGAATAANQSTEITALGTLLTTSAFQARINTLGQKTAANSTPVVLASDQSELPTTGVELLVAVLDATDSAGEELIAAPGAGDAIELRRVEMSNSDSTTNVTAGIVFGAGTEFGKRFLPFGGGAAVTNLSPDFVKGGDNEALNTFLSDDTVDGSILYTVYYRIVAA